MECIVLQYKIYLSSLICNAVQDLEWATVDDFSVDIAGESESVEHPRKEI